MKCSRCGREISDEESYAHQGRVFCEDCLMEVGLHAAQCQPWATYLAGKERAGMTGTEGLTALQQKVYILVRDQGKITREDVKRWSRSLARRAAFTWSRSARRSG
jgi:late competence protein required for DNA uptake (superfamily II DNA/RNA helicase)